MQLWRHEDSIDEKITCTVGEFDVFGVKVLLVINGDGEVNLSTSNASVLNIAIDRVGQAQPTTVTVLQAKKA